jgi:NADH:ubiquinone oxidoreductase subunit 2 (subunit N)
VYYLRIPLALYEREVAEPQAPRREGFGLASAATALTALAVLGLGIVPVPLLDLAERAGGSLFGG